jgi:hypothetical protein
MVAQSGSPTVHAALYVTATGKTRPVKLRLTSNWPTSKAS